jgi:hypothetical protein
VRKKPDIVWEAQSWDNRKVILHVSTLKNHVLRFHFDEAFVVDALKRDFSKPICVIENRRHGTLNAIYDIQCGGHKWLLVAVKFQKFVKRLARKSNFVKSFFGVSEIPSGRLVWGKRP